MLIGDAAGHNDPIIGQGLSIAMRDARIVRDLVLDGARTAAFAAYERSGWSACAWLRLLADVIAATKAEDADNRDARRGCVGERMGDMDAEVFPLIVGMFAGPETIPEELVDEAILDRIRAA